MVNLPSALILVLAATASAASLHKEKRHAHHRRHVKKPCTSVTGPYPTGNSTVTALPETSAAPTSDATSTPSVVTISVVPVPVTTATSAAVETQPATSAPAESSPAGATCGIATTYVTVQQTVTVTAGQVPDTTSSTSTSSTSTSSSSSIYSDPIQSLPVSSAPAVASSPVASAPALLQTGPTAASTSAAPVSTPAAGTGGYTGGKMGVSWIPGVPLSSLGLNGISWAYDWGQVADGVPSGTQYTPTLHDQSKCAGFAAQLASQPGVQFVKHFNEPDMQGNGGAGLSVGTAVSLHQQYIAPLMHKYSIGLPAVTSNNIPGTSGTGYLQSFINGAGCQGFAFADFHFYGGSEDVATQAKIFLGYVDNWVTFIDQACPGQNLPIWISEFSAGPVADGDVGKAAAFMAAAGPALESNPRIARYAYFFPSNSQIPGAVASINSALSGH